MEHTVNTDSAADGQSATARFLQILHAFRSDDLPLSQALAEVDHIVKDGQVAPIDLLAALIQDDAKQPLPIEAFEGFERHLTAHADGNAEEVENDDTGEEETAESMAAHAGAASHAQAGPPGYARSVFAILAGLLVIGLAWAAYYALGNQDPPIVESQEPGTTGEPTVSVDAAVKPGEQSAVPTDSEQASGVSAADWQRQLQAVQEEQRILADALASQRDEANTLRVELEYARTQLAERENELESAQQTQSDSGSAEIARLESQILSLQSDVKDQKRASDALAQENAAEREALLAELNALQSQEQRLQQTLEARRTELESAQTTLAQTQAALNERLKSEDRNAGEIEQLEATVAQLQTAVDEQQRQTEVLEHEQQEERAALFGQLEDLQLREGQLRQTLQSRDEQLSFLQTDLADMKQQQNRRLSEQEQTEQQIAGLLALAENQLESRQLTQPAGNNAYETYQQVLALAPGHSAATSGIGEVKDRYVGWAETATNRENWSQARRYLEAALVIAPGDLTLQAALQDVVQAQESSQRVSELLAAGQDQLSTDLTYLFGVNGYRYEFDNDSGQDFAEVLLRFNAGLAYSF